VWIHQIHAAGGVSGSITMVVLFVGCLCCCGWTRDITSSSYLKKWYKNNLKMRLMAFLNWCEWKFPQGHKRSFLAVFFGLHQAPQADHLSCGHR
jgi:hypothetical protein